MTGPELIAEIDRQTAKLTFNLRSSFGRGDVYEAAIRSLDPFALNGEFSPEQIERIPEADLARFTRVGELQANLRGLQRSGDTYNANIMYVSSPQETATNTTTRMNQ